MWSAVRAASVSCSERWSSLEERRMRRVRTQRRSPTCWSSWYPWRASTERTADVEMLTERSPTNSCVAQRSETWRVPLFAANDDRARHDRSFLPWRWNIPFHFPTSTIVGRATNSPKCWETYRSDLDRLEGGTDQVDVPKEDHPRQCS